MPDLILNPESEVVIFFGPKGKGKSSLMGHFVDDYLYTQGDERWELSEQLIREENAERITPLSFPDRPPVYANTKYKNLKTRTGKAFEPIPIKGKEIGVSNDKETYKALYPAPLIALDEAHREFCSKGDNLPDGQLEFFMECRHHRVIMLLAAPRAVLIHKDIRASGSRFIEPRKVINFFDDFKRLYKTTWYCREFTETSAIEEYISTNGKSDGYIETTYTHNGNIRELYDGYAFRKHFYPKDGKDFEK
ncbi:MAG: zonular occludens toxin domain-containing protein [Clostridia bacterium]|nr:zonular occludens toxin domain-containing protein [Clostridia bacterium]